MTVKREAVESRAKRDIVTVRAKRGCYVSMKREAVAKRIQHKNIIQKQDMITTEHCDSERKLPTCSKCVHMKTGFEIYGPSIAVYN